MSEQARLTPCSTVQPVSRPPPVSAQGLVFPKGPSRQFRSSPGVDVLRHLFVLLTGLGMRESSRKFCEGRDTSANNTGADTAEAGLFQVSYNSIGAHFLLATLFDQYKGSTDLRDIFEEGVSCGNDSWKNWGRGGQ